MIKKYSLPILPTLLSLVTLCSFLFSETPSVAESTSHFPWWGWSLLLFIFTLFLGVIAVLGGVGGGVLFVPIIGSFFPFDLDFVRGTGLLVALCGAIASSPNLLIRGLESMRLGIPMALMGSIGSIVGARIGLGMEDNVIRLWLGIVILFIVLVMLLAKKSEYPLVQREGFLTKLLGIRESYTEESTGEKIEWTVHRVWLGLIVFVFIGFLAGLFGLGAGWANVPALNLILGAPLKIAVGTSSFILTVNDSAAVWVYLSKGAVLPLITVPSVAGMMIGTRIGAHILPKAKLKYVRWIVISMMSVAGLKSLLTGLDIG